MAKLDALTVKNIRDPGRYGDGDGLYLYVKVVKSGKPDASESLTFKSWVQRIVINARRRDIGLGGYPAVSLRQARSLASSNRTAVSEGRDPMAEKQAAKEAARNPAPSVPTFAEAAARVIELHEPTWSNSKHAAQWRSTLKTYAYPVIGKKPVDQITSKDVQKVLEPIWTSKSETASRVKQRIETIMDWVITQGYRLDNPAGKAVRRSLPKVNREQNHHPALHHSQVGWALSKVRESTSHPLNKLAFEFLVLTAARSGEVMKANWGEILWDRRTWEISPLKMKARRIHRVPLSDRAMEILHEALQISGPDGLIFPSQRGGMVSDMTYNNMLKRLRLGIPAVPHGFRSSFTDWAEELMEGYSPAADAALAHQEKSKTRQAYKRTDFFNARIGLMQRWSDYVAGRESSQGGG